VIYRSSLSKYFLTAGLLIINLLGAPLGHAEETSLPKLRLLTYNIHHGQGTDGKFDLERLAKIITELKPDIVALQEVDHKTVRASGVDQAARLGELTGMHSIFGKAMNFSGGGYGVAILSRFPMKEVKNHPLPFREGREPRTILSAKIIADKNLPELIFASTHLCHESDEIRTKQVLQINRLFKPRKGIPVILAGDFNARPGTAPMEALLKDRWIDAIAPKTRIDYLLYRKNDPWRVTHVQIVDERIASDHRPVFAILEWQKAKLDSDTKGSAVPQNVPK